MQTNILRAIALTAVGNAAIGGRTVAGFWPRAGVFRFSKQIDFVVPHGDHAHRVAADPNAWFSWLAATGCRALRLHAAAARQSGKLGPVDEHMLVGLVGGGPRWLIEAAGPGKSSFWEGNDRVGDRNDPQQKIWLNAVVAIAGDPPPTTSDGDVASATRQLGAALVEIEAVALKISWKETFAADFAHAREVLDGAKTTYPGLDFLDYTTLDRAARRLLAAAAEAWVFGAMGSWNDGTPDPPLAEPFERTSAALFAALKSAVVAVANASLPAALTR